MGAIELSTDRMDPRVGSRFCRILADRVSTSDFLDFYSDVNEATTIRGRGQDPRGRSQVFWPRGLTSLDFY